MRTPALLLASLALILGCTNNPGPPTSTAGPAPNPPPQPMSTRVTDTFPTKNGEVRVTPIYHATVLLEVSGKTLYLDPYSKGDFTGLPKADFVLITDIHPDHYDPKALDIVATPDTRFIVPKVVAAELKGRTNISLMAIGEKTPHGVFEVEAVPMYNVERGPEPGKLFHEKGRGNGYVLTFGDKRFYFSGDTECVPEVKALKDIDVAFLCMNLPYTMPPKEAAACVNAFKPKVLIPYHFGVPGGETSNLDELKGAIDPAAGVEVRIRKWY
jgi:L-ascorbate metabolism protein UlaG (beta-lactamase superfamily)